MVKVIIDGKEYEAKHNVEVEFGVSLTIKEPKQEFVSVPKEIQFVGWGDDDLNLVITKNSEYFKLLEYDNTSWFVSNYNANTKTINPIYCVLVPTKREELKAGDWAFRCEWEDSIKSQELFKFCLILNEFNHVYVQQENRLISVNEGHEGYSYWFKVVPRSEVEKHD